MSACKSLLRSSLCCIECRLRTSNSRAFSYLSFHSVPPFLYSPCFPLSLPFSSLHHRNRVLYGVEAYRRPPRSYSFIDVAMSQETFDCVEETPIRQNIMIETAEEACKDTVEELLSSGDDVSRLLKMERRADVTCGGSQCARSSRWFPYLDKFKAGDTYLNSSEVLEALDPHIMETRKERFMNVVRNRSYSVCLVVEGLSDFGNVSAAFRSADALGLQSVHVVSCDSSKRYRDNRHVSMGAEKWLDIELWDSTQDCFSVLKSRGYRIATTHVGTNAVSIYDMDWSLPTAIVVGNEKRGISKEALEMSDLHCSIPMKGMVDSFNVSVAAGILMHHAVCDRIARMGCHGDLTKEESQMLLAEFSLRHSKSTLSIASEYAKRKPAMFISKL